MKGLLKFLTRRRKKISVSPTAASESDADGEGSEDGMHLKNKASPRIENDTTKRTAHGSGNGNGGSGIDIDDDGRDNNVMDNGFAVNTNSEVMHSANGRSVVTDGKMSAIVGIFHDMENVWLSSTGADETVAMLSQNLRKALKKELQCSDDIQIKTFKTYVDSQLAKPVLRRALSSQGIDTIDVSHLENGEKDAVDKVMLVDTCFFFTDHLFHINGAEKHKVVVLISGDRDFSVMAKRLAQRSVKVIIVLRDRKQPVTASLTSGMFRVFYLSDLISPRASSVSSSTAAQSSKKTVLPKHRKRKKKTDAPKKPSNADLINAISEHLHSAPQHSMLCSQLGTLLRNESGLQIPGLISFIARCNEFVLEGTNGNERVTLKEYKTSEERIAAIFEILSESPAIWIKIHELGTILAERGFPKQKKKISELIRLHPNVIKMRGQDMEMEAALMSRLANKDCNENKNNDTSQQAERTQGERISAIIEILSKSSVEWVKIHEMGQLLAERGFPKQKPKVSELIRLYSNNFKMRGEESQMEVALMSRLGNNERNSDTFEQMERTQEERISAIIEILSKSSAVWITIQDLDANLAERGFPSQKPTVSELIQLCPKDITIRGKSSGMEAALSKRLNGDNGNWTINH